MKTQVLLILLFYPILTAQAGTEKIVVEWITNQDSSLIIYNAYEYDGRHSLNSEDIAGLLIEVVPEKEKENLIHEHSGNFYAKEQAEPFLRMIGLTKDTMIDFRRNVLEQSGTDTHIWREQWSSINEKFMKASGEISIGDKQVEFMQVDISVAKAYKAEISRFFEQRIPQPELPHLTEGRLVILEDPKLKRGYSINFGKVTEGERMSRTARLGNIGRKTIEVSRKAWSGGPFSIETGTSFKIASQQDTTIKIDFQAPNYRKNDSDGNKKERSVTYNDDFQHEIQLVLRAEVIESAAQVDKFLAPIWSELTLRQRKIFYGGAGLALFITVLLIVWFRSRNSSERDAVSGNKGGERKTSKASRRFAFMWRWPKWLKRKKSNMGSWDEHDRKEVMDKILKDLNMNVLEPQIWTQEIETSLRNSLASLSDPVIWRIHKKFVRDKKNIELAEDIQRLPQYSDGHHHELDLERVSERVMKDLRNYSRNRPLLDKLKKIIPEMQEILPRLQKAIQPMSDISDMMTQPRIPDALFSRLNCIYNLDDQNGMATAEDIVIHSEAGQKLFDELAGYFGAELRKDLQALDFQKKVDRLSEWVVEAFSKKMVELKEAREEQENLRLTIKPLIEYFGLQMEELIQLRNAEPQKYDKIVEYLKKVDVFLPGYIKDFENLLNVMIFEITNILNDRSQDSKWKRSFRSVLYGPNNNAGLTYVSALLGTNLDRKKLLEELGLQNYRDLKNFQKQKFYKDILAPYFIDILHNLVRLYSYTRIHTNEIDIEKDYEKNGINVEVLSQLYYQLHYYLQNHFKIRLKTVNLFEEKFDANIHERVSDSIFVRIDPIRYKSMVSTLASGTIYDMETVGLESEELGLGVIKPKVVVKQ